MISSWVRLCRCADLPQSMTSTSSGSVSSSSRGASRSTTTTSASASSRRPRTVISPGSPGPPPTSATRPGRPVPAGAGGPAGRRRPARPRSRRAGPRARPGSSPPLTATVTPSCRATAGVRAVPSPASSARTQKMRRRSAPVGHRGVHGRVVGAGHRQPRAVEIAGRERAVSRRDRRPSQRCVATPRARRRARRRRPPRAPAPGASATVPPPTTTTRRPDTSSSSGNPVTRPDLSRRRA